MDTVARSDPNVIQQRDRKGNGRFTRPDRNATAAVQGTPRAWLMHDLPIGLRTVRDRIQMGTSRRSCPFGARRIRIYYTDKGRFREFFLSELLTGTSQLEGSNSERTFHRLVVSGPIFFTNIIQWTRDLRVIKILKKQHNRIKNYFFHVLAAFYFDLVRHACLFLKDM